MWTRGQLKNKARQSLKGNYWRIVLVSLIIFLLGGGALTVVNNIGNLDSTTNVQSDDTYIENELDLDSDDVYSSMELQDGGSREMQLGILAIAVIAGLVLWLIALVVSLVYGTFIYNPFDVGAKRFFYTSLKEKANIKEITYAFDNNYKNIAKTLFIRDLKLLLWTMLFIIPGIVKSFEYLMMPYLLAENPNLTRQEAFRLSEQMMTGNKWKAFMLNLSFIGWNILSGITCGLVGIFYVEPYKNLTFAALYEELSAQNGYPARPAVSVADVEENESTNVETE